MRHEIVEEQIQHIDSESDDVRTTTIEPQEKKNSRRSIVWKHFEEHEIVKEGVTYAVATCQHCGITLPAHTRRNETTGLRNHLIKVCETSPLFTGNDSNQPMLTQSIMGGDVVSHVFNQKRLDMKCVKWIIKAEMPFRSVDQPDFREFIMDLQPKYKIPNRKKIASAAWDMFCLEKAYILSVISDVRVSITTDIWTSIQNINYMVVTAHFIDLDFKLHKRVINFTKIISHKGEEIGRCLEEKLNEWGIDKVFSITVDNATSNDVAIEYMKKRLRSHGTLLLDGYHLHMRCTCHIINLIVKDGMKELVEAIEGVRNCVKFIHSSSARLDKFREYCVLCKKDKMSTVPMDVVTRWNATYSMLQSAHKFKDVFARLAEDSVQFIAYFKENVTRDIDGVKVHAKRVGPPVDEDWEKAMSFAHFLKKFYDATIKLSATKTPTSHLILKTLVSLKMEIDSKFFDDTNLVLQKVAASMKLKFDKYWGSFGDTNLLMFIAQALDPRYKFQMIELILKSLGYDNEEVDQMKSKIKRHLNDMYQAYKASIVERTNVIRIEENYGLMDDVEANLERLLNLQRREAKLKEISNEVDKYLNDAYESTTNEEFNLLDWWRVNNGHYPTLAKVARDVLAIPSSTVASENAFSLGGRVVDPFRASLTPKMVEALVCTSDWLKGEEFQFYKEPTEDEIEFFKELEEIEQNMPNVEIPPPPPVQIPPPPPAHQKLPPRPPSASTTVIAKRIGSNSRGRASKRGRGSSSKRVTFGSTSKS